MICHSENLRKKKHHFNYSDMKKTVVTNIPITTTINPYKTILQGVALLWEEEFYVLIEDNVLLIITESLRNILSQKDKIPFCPEFGKVIINDTCAGYKYLTIPDDIGREAFGLDIETIGLVFYKSSNVE